MAILVVSGDSVGHGGDHSGLSGKATGFWIGFGGGISVLAVMAATAEVVSVGDGGGF